MRREKRTPVCLQFSSKQASLETGRLSKMKMKVSIEICLNIHFKRLRCQGEFLFVFRVDVTYSFNRYNRATKQIKKNS